MSEVIQVGETLFAVHLHWNSLMGHGPVNKRIATAAKKLKATRYVRHVASQHQRGLVAEDDICGFFQGKLPKIKGRKRPVYALASVFARSAEASSIWVYGLSDDKFLVIGSKNGHPVLDEIHSRGSVHEAAERYKMEEAIGGARLYFSGEIDEDLLHDLEELFAVFDDAPPSFTESDDSARLTDIPSGTSVLPYAGIAILTAGAWFGWTAYSEKIAAEEAAKHVLTPEQQYVSLRDQALAQTPLVSAGRFIKAIRTSELWPADTSPTGWRLEGIECTANPEGALCVRGWKRSGGTFEDLKEGLKKQVVTVSLDSAADETQIPLQPAPISILKTFPSEGETKFVWGTFFQRIKDISSFHIDSGNGQSAAPKGVLQADLTKGALVGQWPTSPAPADNKEMIKSSAWSVSGPLAWLADLEQLPPQFILQSFSLSQTQDAGAAFKVGGILLSH